MGVTDCSLCRGGGDVGMWCVVVVGGCGGALLGWLWCDCGGGDCWWVMVVAGDVGLWTHRSQRPTRKTSRRGRRRRRGAGSRESFRFRWAQALRVVGACTALSLSSHRATSNQQSDQTIKPKAKPNQYTITTFFITIPDVVQP
eukprot:7220487-Prymnesium_polylepis.1